MSVEGALLYLVVGGGGPDAHAWLTWVVSAGPMPVPAMALDITWPAGVVPA